MSISENQAFHNERLTGIGGSDCAGIFNLGYGCRRKLFYEKRRVLPDYPTTEAPELERGTLLEPVVAELYRKRTGRPVRLMPLQRHILYDWMIVHVDGETEAPDKPGPGYVEFKCINRFAMKQFKREGLREQYILQLQHGMAVCGYQWGSFGLLCIDPWEFAWFDVARDEDMIEQIITEGDVLWSRIQNGPEPDPLPDPKDKRCGTCPWRKTCRKEELAALDSTLKEADKTLPLRADLLPLVAEVVELAELAKEAGELHGTAKNELKQALENLPGIIVPGFRVYHTASNPDKWDTKALDALQKKALDTYKAFATQADNDLLNKIKPLIDIIEVFVDCKRKSLEPTRTMRIYSSGD